MLLRQDNPTQFLHGNTDAEISPYSNIQWQVGVCYRPEEVQAHMLQKKTNSIKTTETHSNGLLLGGF